MRHARAGLSMALAFAISNGSAATEPTTRSDEGEEYDHEPHEPYAASAVVEVPGVSADDLFRRAQGWMTSGFAAYRGETRTTDAANRALIGRGSFHYVSKIFMGSAATVGDVSFSVRVETKDGRYRVSISDFVHECTAPQRMDVFIGAVPLKPASFGLVTWDPQPLDCSGLRTLGCPTAWSANVMAELRELARQEARDVHQALKAAMLREARNDDW